MKFSIAGDGWVWKTGNPLWIHIRTDKLNWSSPEKPYNYKHHLHCRGRKFSAFSNCGNMVSFLFFNSFFFLRLLVSLDSPQQHTTVALDKKFWLELFPVLNYLYISFSLVWNDWICPGRHIQSSGFDTSAEHKSMINPSTVKFADFIRLEFKSRRLVYPKGNPSAKWTGLEAKFSKKRYNNICKKMQA